MLAIVVAVFRIRTALTSTKPIPAAHATTALKPVAVIHRTLAARRLNLATFRNAPCIRRKAGAVILLFTAMAGAIVGAELKISIASANHRGAQLARPIARVQVRVPRSPRPPTRAA